MNREDWQKAKELFHRALDEPPENRAAYLDEACAGNDALREQVEILLESYETDFLEEPLFNEKSGLFEEVLSKSGTVENDIKVAPDADSIKSLTRNETKTKLETEENDLRPSRLRFVLVCLLFHLRRSSADQDPIINFECDI